MANVYDTVLDGVVESAGKQAHYDFIHKPTADPTAIRTQAIMHAQQELFGDGGLTHEFALDGYEITRSSNLIAWSYIDEYHRLISGEVQPVDPTEAQ